MKSFECLTRRGRVRRMRQLAESALKAYGLIKPQFKLISVAGENTLFRVYDRRTQLSKESDTFFEPNQYLLRIYAKNYQATEDIQLEMKWLTAIRKDANLPVPEPVPNLQGEFITQITYPGIPDRRDCILLRWLKGRFCRVKAQPKYYRAQGRIMAQLHNHAAKWKPPKNLRKRCFDWDGLFQGDIGVTLPASKAWSLLSDRFMSPYLVIADEFKEMQKTWGKGSDVFGLIHADCGIDANVIFVGDEARIIDFDNSGFGYWMYDLAISMEHCWDTLDYERFQQSVLEGYGEYRNLSQGQLDQLELFLAAYYVKMGLWETVLMHTDPRRDQKELLEWQEYGFKFIVRYLNCH